jgi:hypothetical protein
MRWPTAPFHHAAQIVHQWACLAYGFVGKQTTDPNSAPQSRPGIFIGHSPDTSGYLLYHEDTDDVITYGYVEAFPHIFPCVEMKLAGENPATIASGDWRRYYHYSPHEVADGPFAEFACGKQLEVRLPKSMFPGYKGQWKATCQRPIYLQNDDKDVCMRIVFTGYTGQMSVLKPADIRCLNRIDELFIDIPITKPNNPL